MHNKVAYAIGHTGYREDHAMFAHGYEQATATVEAWTKPTKAAFEFWVSFWPVAPLFGVEWRFADATVEKAGAAAPAKPAKAARKKAVKIAPVSGDVDEAAGSAVAEAEKALAEAGARTVAATVKAAAQTAEIATETASAVVETVVEAVAPVAEPAAEAAQAPLDLAFEAVPAPTAEPEDAAPADGAPSKPKGLLKKAPADADDLKLIRGIGPGLERQLNGLGVYRFSQIAGFSDTDLAWVDDNLTAFKGRCFRDDWIGQAKSLMG